MGSIVLRGAVPDFFDGSGSGSGYGDGYGSGSGSGSGYGDGSGSGYGDGYGDGSGSGSGSGYGSGYGDGSGSGSGYGDGEYWLACLKYFIDKLPDVSRARAAQLQKNGVKLAYWRSTADGRPANGGSAPPVQPGTVHRESGPLNLCHRGTLHATLIPPKWRGERWWIVALHGEVVGDDEKMGCLEREVIGECT